MERVRPRNGGRVPVAAAAAAEEPRAPRGIRETAALLRANGYGVLNQERLRGVPEQADAAAYEPQQQQQQQRHVRVVEPAGVRRLAQKRKAAEVSLSEDERPTRPTRGGAAAGLQEAPAAHAQAQSPQAGGMKRVRSAWKMRPLLVDEKLAVFLEGQDDSLLHYDGGEFYQWLQDCKAGRADPAEGFPFPLVVQDRDLRTVLEIKPPPEQQQADGDLRQAAAAAAAPAAARSAAAGDGIIVPVVRELPLAEQPDSLVRSAGPPVVQRMQMQPAEQPDVAGTSAAAQAASAAWRSAERAVALDPPYIRYVQPTPDDLDLAVEYDLDEDDEEWLEQYNTEAKRAKSRKGRRVLGEEWMEHLMDRMEKEYTAELQKHPGKWLMQTGDPSGSDQPPAITIPSIQEMFPLEACLQVPGINHYENVIVAVYEYWRAKHERAGRPLIQRLWYEPPWDRKKAAQRLASNAEDGGEGASQEGPFWAQDSPVALAGIRRRRMDPEEVKSRFQDIRRDLESSRTLADQIRKREKLKRRELQLYKEEWAARMQAVHDGAQRVVVRQGRVKDPPAQLSAVWRLELAAEMEAEESELDEERAAMGAPQDAAAQAEDRAARLASRRFARGVVPPGHQQQRYTAEEEEQEEQPVPVRRPVGRPRSSNTQRKAERQHTRPAAAGRAAANGSGNPVLSQGGNVRGPPAAPGVRRVAQCVWCGSGNYLMLGCAACPRCFCFKCFQRRPGLGINNWSRAVKDPAYTCVICRGLDAEDAPSANPAGTAPAADAADATSPRRRTLAQAQQVQQRRRQSQPAQQPAAKAGEPSVGVPRGLGGAALRSYLLKRQRHQEQAEDDDDEEEEEEEEEDSSSDEEQQRALQQRQRQQQHHHAFRPRLKASHTPAAALPASPGRLRRQSQAHHRAGASSTSGSDEIDDEGQRRPQQRKLGGAALASHLKRLQQRRHERHRQGEEEEEEQQQQQQQQQQQPGSDDGGGDDSWPYTHIPPPPRKLGGAALRSYVRRQEALLEASDSEQPATSGQLGALAGAEPGEWPYSHIPPPPRKLGGAALRSYIKRQEQLLEQSSGSGGSEQEEQQEEEEEQGASDSSEQPASSHGVAAAGAGDDGWPYTHIPPPPRKLGGAALHSYVRRQEQLLEEAQAEEEERGGGDPSGSSSGTAEEFGAIGSSEEEEEEEEEEETTTSSGLSDRTPESSDFELSADYKENRAPRTKRQRALGGAALAAHLRKQQAAAAATAGRRRGPTAPSRPRREAQGLRLQARRG